MRLISFTLSRISHHRFSRIFRRFFSQERFPFRLSCNRALALSWMLWMLWIQALSFGTLSSAAELPGTKILSVEYAVDEHQESIILFLDRPPEYSSTTLKQPDRIVIDIQNSYFPEIRLVRNINGGIIQSCRISQNTKNKARVVLDVGKRYEYNIFLHPASIKKEYLLTVVVTPKLHDTKSQISSTKTNSKSTATATTTVASDYNNNNTKNRHETAGQLDSNNSDNKPVITVIGSDKIIDPPSGSHAMIFDSNILDEMFRDEPSPEDAIPSETDDGRVSPFSISGSIQTRFHTDTVHKDSGERNGNEHTQGVINRTILTVGYGNFLILSALSDYRYAGHRNSYDDYDLDLYEAYFKYSRDRLSLKIGKQIRRWGKADQFSPVDTLNPEDIREFITLEYEDRKIPVWMADATLKFSSFSVEAVYIPIFEPLRMDYFGTDWAVYTHLKDDIQDNAAVPAPLKRYFDRMSVHSTEPDDHALNGEWALRISTSVKGWDLGATYHYTWEDMPFYESFPVKNLNIDGAVAETDILSALNSVVLTGERIEITYLRSNIIGFEFETILSDFGVRGEAAWHDSQPLLTSSLVSVDKPVFYGIIGADYTGENNWYLNVQLSYIHIADYESSVLFFKRDSIALLGEINKNFFSSWVNLSLHYNIALNENQWYISPRIEYSYIPNLDITLGAHIFEGRIHSFMGRYDENDQLFLDLKYHF